MTLCLMTLGIMAKREILRNDFRDLFKGKRTLSIMPFRKMTLRIMTLCLMTFGIMVEKERNIEK